MNDHLVNPSLIIMNEITDYGPCLPEADQLPLMRQLWSAATRRRFHWARPGAPLLSLGASTPFRSAVVRFLRSSLRNGLLHLQTLLPGRPCWPEGLAKWVAAWFAAAGAEPGLGQPKRRRVAALQSCLPRLAARQTTEAAQRNLEEVLVRPLFIISAFIFLLLFASFALAATPKPIYKLTRTDDSPMMDIVVEHYRVNAKNEDKLTTGETSSQIWLSEREHRENRELLYGHSRHAEVVFSPDESHLAINDHDASNHSLIKIFLKKGDFHFAPISLEDSSVEEKVWRYFLQLNNPTLLKDINPGEEPLTFDHAYIDCIAWSHDGSTFLVKLRGHLDSKNYTREWFCVFDLKTMQPTLDLTIMNRRAVSFDGKIIDSRSAGVQHK